MMQIGLKDMYSVAMINMLFWFKKNTEIQIPPSELLIQLVRGANWHDFAAAAAIV